MKIFQHAAASYGAASLFRHHIVEKDVVELNTDGNPERWMEAIYAISGAERVYVACDTCLGQHCVCNLMTRLYQSRN